MLTLRKVWIILPGIAVILVAVWLARAWVAARLAENYFQQHGIASSVGFGRFSLSGVSGKIVLGPGDAPDFSADAVAVEFDPLSLVPRIVAVRLIRPVIRAQLDAAGHVSLPNLQHWIDSLSSGGGSHSRFVSDDLAISLSQLRALLATPGGALELDGDARLQRGALVAAAITARPASITYQDMHVRLAGAVFRLEPAAQGYAVAAHFKGSVSTATLQATDMVAELSAPLLKLDWSARTVAAPALHLQLAAASLKSGSLTASKASLDLTAQDVHAALNGTNAGASVHAMAGADFMPPDLVAQYPALAQDRRIAQALQANLRHVDLALDAHVARQNNGLDLTLDQPMAITGARGGILRVARFTLNGEPSLLHGGLDAALSGGGLPPVSLRAENFRWQDGAFTSDAALAAHFDFAMLHGASIAMKGTASYRDGSFAFALESCAPVSLSAFHPGDSDMAQTVRAALCAAPGAQFFAADSKGWTLDALAQGVAMTVPLGTLDISDGAARVAFADQNAQIGGKIAITAARLTDKAALRRFEPLAASGTLALDKWVWHGAFAVSDTKNNALGTANFTHALATGSGTMTIAAPHLQFAPDKLQPAMLSPLLGAVSKVQGGARFDGAIAWSRAGFQSHGTLVVDKLDLLTPLGTAHAVDTTIVLTSLLPPVTAPGQHIAISRIDWALPLSGVAVDFSFGNGALHVENLASTISEGRVTLGAFSVALTGPYAMQGAASIDGLSLAPLVAASNMGDKVKLQGKVTGTIPFTLGAEGFRIANGHLASTGPGRISLDRSLWANGSAVATNAVQDLAYQALENLAFDQLSADINSIAGGRLQVVFHIKGRSDPPVPQQAEVAIADILNGTALQKPIKLTSGTPIDLTLDTSLNFDELLKSYAETWSKTLAQAGQSN